MIKGRVIPPVFTRWFLRSLHLITWKFTQPPFGASAAPVLTSKQDTAPRRGWANRSTGGRAKTGAAVRSHFMWITASRSAGCQPSVERNFFSLSFFLLFNFQRLLEWLLSWLIHFTNYLKQNRLRALAALLILWKCRHCSTRGRGQHHRWDHEATNFPVSADATSLWWFF